MIIMNVKYIDSLLFFCAPIFFAVLLDCQANEHDYSLSVDWDTGYTLPDLLASPFELNKISDLEKLMDAAWYAEFAMNRTNVGESIFNSCRDYFGQAINGTHTSNENEMGPYLEFKVMCEATRILLSAKKPKFNFLPILVLADDLPNLLPKAVALQTSLAETNRNAKNSALVHWADITPITKYESHSITKSTYSHNGGYQEFEIVGKGDADNNNFQDVFVVVRDYLESGNYFNIRLLVLSVDSDNNWQLIEAL